MQIFVQTMPTGETMSLCIGVDETLTTLKAKIQDKEGPPSNKQTIIFAGKQLEGGSVLLTKSTKIRDGDTMYLFDRRPAGNLLGGNKGGGDGGGDGGGNKGGGDGGGDGGDHGCDDDEAAPPLLPSSGMQIFVITTTAKTITLDVAESYTIDNVKFMIAGHPDGGKVPPDMQRLLFGGKDIEGDMTLRDCNIAAGSTLQLSMFIDGGAGGRQQCKKDLMLKKKKVFTTTSNDKALFVEAFDMSLHSMTVSNVNAIEILRSMAIEDLVALKHLLEHGKETFAVKLKEIVSYVPQFRKLTMIEGKIVSAKDRMSDVLMESLVETFVKDSGAVNIELLKQEIRVSIELKPAGHSAADMEP